MSERSPEILAHEGYIKELIDQLDFIEDKERASPYALVDCFAFNKILDFATNGEAKADDLIPQKKDKDWLTCMKNIKSFAKVAEPIFEKNGIKFTVEATATARFSKPTAYLDFIIAIVQFMFVSPQKKVFEEKLQKCSEEAQKYIKSLISGASTQTSEPAKEEEKAKVDEPIKPKKTLKKEMPTPPTEPKQSPQVQQKSSFSVGTTTALRRAKIKNESLNKQLAELKAEYEKVSQHDEAAPAEDDNLRKLKKELEEAKKTNESLDEELKKYQDPTQEKEMLQKEIATLKEQIAEAEGKLNTPIDITQLQQSENPEIKEIIEKIKAAEERIKPEHEIELRIKSDKLKEIAKKLKADVSKYKEKAGEIKEEPGNEEAAKLEEEISEVINRNNQLNKDIMAILSRTEAIDRCRSSRSFLEHLRTSDAFLSTH